MSAQSLTSLEGEIVSRSFNAGYVVPSYLVSYVGAWTTLELVNRRTAMRGTYNWFLLAAAAISMGGIAIWCMHFIGNRAIVLGGGENESQIVYSSGFTALSFFIPVIVLFLALWAVGSNEQVSITRVTLGGTLAGFGVCGMHYLGQAGISNYDCVYNVAYVVGAGIIAVSASIGALGLFFLFRSSWDTSWWKRASCAIVLAGAVSGMHWLASVGTQYRLRKTRPTMANTFSRMSTVIVVIVFSVAGCFILLLFSILAQRRILRSAKRAQQIVLAAAVFNTEGRILVTPEGLLPNRKITNTWLERSPDDVFSVSHPVYLWMFRTSRYWGGVSTLLAGMRHHVYSNGIKGRLGRLGSIDGNLLNEEGMPIEDYSLVFRELFCVAAADLADDLNQPLDRVGILYDEIITTGQEPKSGNKRNGENGTEKLAISVTDLEREAAKRGPSGKGQLLFLVSRVGRREAEHLQAAGYRFANPTNVIPILTSSLQVVPHTLNRRIQILRDYVTDPHMLEPGVHMACFAIRASLGAGHHGFDLLARKDALNQLPTMQLPYDTLEGWQIEYLKNMDSTTVASCIKAFYRASKPNNPSQKEQEFAQCMLISLEALKEEIEDPFFNDALLIATPIGVPCRGHSEESPPGTAIVINFRIIVPIHSRAPGKKLAFVPLNYFKMQQHVYKNSPDHEAFARKTYREFAPILDLKRAGSFEDERAASVTSNGFGSNISHSSMQKIGQNNDVTGQVDMFGNPIQHLHPKSRAHRGPSKIKFWEKTSRHNSGFRNDNSSEKNLVEVHENQSLGGIMVSQEVSVDVGAGGQETRKPVDTPRRPGIPTDQPPEIEMGKLTPAGKGIGVVTKATKEEEETETFVDELFTICIAKRH